MKKSILIFIGASMIYACDCRPTGTCEGLIEQRANIISYCSGNDKMSLIQSTDSMLVRCHCGGAIKDSVNNENNNN